MENSDVFVVRMDEDGEFDWGVARGSANAEEYPTALHVNASGFIALSGFYAGVGDVGGGALPDSGTDFAGFVTNIDVATRQNLVTHSMTVAAGGSGVNIRGPVAMNAGDDTMVAGTFESTVTFSGADYTSEGESDILYARFDPAGDNPVVFSGAGADAVSGVVFSQGGVFVAGEFAVDIELTEVNEASDGLDAFLFRGDELLTSISWDMTTQSAGDERVVWFDADATGNVYVVGAYTEAIQWPGTQREDAVELDDIWLTKVSPTGTVQWLKSFGGLGNDMPRNLAVSDSGEVVIAGEFASTIEFGDTSHNLIGGDMDAFVAKFDTDGNVVWSHAGGGQGTDRALAVEFAPDGSVYAAYSFFADADFGGGVIVVAQNGSAIVKYAP
jgi:hypothetical protein